MVSSAGGAIVVLVGGEGGVETNSFWKGAVMDMRPQNSRSREGMFRRSAAAQYAAPNSLRPRRVGVEEGVPRVSAVEAEGEEQLRVSFLGWVEAINFANLRSALYLMMPPRLTPASLRRWRGIDGQ